MKLDQVRTLNPLQRLLYFIQEREAVRLKKEAGAPKPWTDDEILQNYRFTCVRRWDDKVSQWLWKHWYEPNFDHPNMLAACALARFFNLPATLETIGFPLQWNWGRLKQKLRALKKRQTIFNAAYMVRGNDGVDKIASVIDFTIKPLVKRPPPLFRDSMEHTWENLRCRYGFGSFMAGQVVADARWAIQGTWQDKDSWAPRGPGSVRGVNWLYQEIGPVSQEEFEGRLEYVIDECKKNLPEQITSRLEAQDYQSCLCEYDKYSRTLFGQGKPKQLYPGRD